MKCAREGRDHCFSLHGGRLHVTINGCRVLAVRLAAKLESGRTEFESLATIAHGWLLANPLISSIPYRRSLAPPGREPRPFVHLGNSTKGPGTIRNVDRISPVSKARVRFFDKLRRAFNAWQLRRGAARAAGSPG